MAFHKLTGKDKRSIWPEVFDPELNVKIEHTTRDMPKNPTQMLIFVRRDDSTLFTFTVTESVIESEVGHDYTRVFSGSFEKITQGFQKNNNILPEFNSEDEFVSYVKNGTELMFTNEGAAARGVKFVLRLI